MTVRTLLPALAALVALITFVGCDSHDGVWGPPGGSLPGAVVINGGTDASGVVITVNDRNYAATTVTTGPDGTYSFWCGDEDLCRITAHADSTVERDLVTDVRGGQGATPGTIYFTGLGAVSGTVSVAGATTGNGGVLVALEGTSVNAVTDDAGNYTMTSVPAGTYTIAATVAGHMTVTMANQTVSYKTTTQVPNLAVQ